MPSVTAYAIAPRPVRFTSKNRLFQQALTRSLETMTSRQLAVLEDSGRTPADRLRDLLTLVVGSEEAHRVEGRPPGCLAGNATAEFAEKDSAVAAPLDRDREARFGALEAVLAAGQREGTIASAPDTTGTGFSPRRAQPCPRPAVRSRCC